MDARELSDAIRHFASGLTRRDALRGLLTGAGAIAATSLSPPEPARARRKKRCKPKQAGAFCETHKECCPQTTRRKCKVADNASNSDTTCCGVQGAACGGVNGDLDTISPHCCAGYRCSTADVPNGGPGLCEKPNDVPL
jgi:hypothetical protein